MRCSMISEDKPDVGIYSYGDKMARKSPLAQFIFDVSKFRDPSGQKQFQGYDGTNPFVREWIQEDPKVAAVIQNAMILVSDLRLDQRTPDEVSKGLVIKPRSNWVSFAFKDTHGKWIAPAIAELVADEFDKLGFKYIVTHYGLMGGK